MEDTATGTTGGNPIIPRTENHYGTQPLASAVRVGCLAYVYPLWLNSCCLTPNVQLSTDEAVMRAEALLINKMNLVLVQVLKQEWPTNWPTFIPDLVEASK